MARKPARFPRKVLFPFWASLHQRRSSTKRVACQTFARRPARFPWRVLLPLWASAHRRRVTLHSAASALLAVVRVHMVSRDRHHCKVSSDRVASALRSMVRVHMVSRDTHRWTPGGSRLHRHLRHRRHHRLATLCRQGYHRRRRRHHCYQTGTSKNRFRRHRGTPREQPSRSRTTWAEPPAACSKNLPTSWHKVSHKSSMV